MSEHTTPKDQSGDTSMLLMQLLRESMQQPAPAKRGTDPIVYVLAVLLAIVLAAVTYLFIVPNVTVTRSDRTPLPTVAPQSQAETAPAPTAPAIDVNRFLGQYTPGNGGTQQQVPAPMQPAPQPPQGDPAVQMQPASAVVDLTGRPVEQPAAPVAPAAPAADPFVTVFDPTPAASPLPLDQELAQRGVCDPNRPGGPSILCRNHPANQPTAVPPEEAARRAQQILGIAP